MSSKSTRNMVLAAMFLAMAMLLPFVTGQNVKLGNMICPMHIPVLLCGFFCGPFYGLAVGLIAPLLRFLIFTRPPMPTALFMSFELATYGLVSALLYRAFSKKTWGIYAALIGAMIAGRVVSGVVQFIFAGLNQTQFSLSTFIESNVIITVPGIILQIVLIPILVLALKRYTED